MNEQTQTRAGTGDLINDTQALLSATAQVAGEKVVEARQRLLGALEMAKKSLGAAQVKAVASAKATDQAIREHPYHAVGVAIGVGALIGYLVGRRMG